MSHATLALGATALFAAGCVWYLPAAAALRAGADRPYSHRIAAASCVTFWCTPALVAVLLLTPAPWSALGAVTAAGLLTAAALLAVSRLQRSREQHEESQRWSTLRQGGTGAHAPVSTPPGNPARAQLTFLLYLLPGNIVASVIATTVLLTADSLTRQSAVTATVTAVGISAASLAIAGTRAQATRRH
ncbi:hypothetical protein [Streptomyces sp. Ac-502]|uniref:hypothetical protein n=1 Tax=Streptomyces sp. Ac-502 TaxID=3342801 RepID=UPI0038628EFE